MNIVVHDHEVPAADQAKAGYLPFTLPRLRELRAVAKRYYFSTAENGDGTLTIYGPRYFNSDELVNDTVVPYEGGGARPIFDFRIVLPLEVAYVRLLSEVCCAMAQKPRPDVFSKTDRPMDLPFSDDRKFMQLNSKFFRRLVNAYISVAVPGHEFE